MPAAPDALAEAGLVDIKTFPATVEVPVTNPETFLRGERSHGYRSFFDELQPTDRTSLEEELLAWLAHMQTQGGIVLEREATFAVGRARMSP